MPPPQAVPTRLTPKAKKKTIKRLLSYVFKQHKSTFFLVALCIVISVIASTTGSVFLGVLIDNYIRPMLSQSVPNFTGLAQAIGIMAGIFAVGILSTFIYNRLMIIIAQGVLKDIRNTLFAHMQQLPLKYFDTRTHGEIMSHFTNDTDALRQMLTQGLPQMFASAMTIVAVFVAMLATSWHLTLVVLGWLIFTLTISGNIAKKSRRYFIAQQQTLGKTNGYIEEMISGQKVIKVFCYEANTKQAFDDLNNTLCDQVTKANQFANILMPLMNNLGNLQYVTIAIIGGILAINHAGQLTLGAIVSFLQLSRTFSMPINQISQQLNAVMLAIAGAERIFELIDEPEEENDGEITLEKTDAGTWMWKIPQPNTDPTYIQLKGDVRLNDVSFKYSPDGKMVLQHINLYAKPGQKVAFVGATGAGKTTITNLLNRFYDITEGTITYDGINLEDINKKDLRRALGMVLQDTHLFTGSVLENIRYGNLEADKTAVHTAAKRANAAEFIAMLPQGYDTVLTSDGADLSQGQRQLLSIARAEVADPAVMILDEATSSIDTRTEAIIQTGMDTLMQGRTVFVIAHRLSTVQNADVIMVLESGNITERGSHEDLLKQQGTYYQLYTGAFELE